MPIEQTAGSIVITGESILHYRLLLLIKGLETEIKGFRMTLKGRTCYSILKSEYGLRGNKVKVLSQAYKVMDNVKKEYA